MSWQDSLSDYVEFLKTKHSLSDEQIQQELFDPKVPVDAFASEITPLQVASIYLTENLKKSEKEAAKLLGRTTAEITRACSVKHKKLATTGVKIRATIFADRELSASEHLVEQLETRGSSIAEIASTLKKSEQTIWTLHYRVEKKRGGRNA